MAPEARFRVYQLAVTVSTGRDLAPRDLAEKAFCTEGRFALRNGRKSSLSSAQLNSSGDA